MNLDPLPLDDLVARALSGDERAFAILVEQTLDEVRCCVAMRASDIDMAEEAVQTTYIDAYRNLVRYQAGGSVIAWLKGIARHRVQRAQRERQRQARVEHNGWAQLMEMEDESSESITAPTSTETSAALRECLNKLNPAIGLLLERYYREQTPLIDLAKQTGRSPSGLAVTLCRARTTLRECLRRKGMHV